jgi:hypothetical protein
LGFPSFSSASIFRSSLRLFANILTYFDHWNWAAISQYK